MGTLMILIAVKNNHNHVFHPIFFCYIYLVADITPGDDSVSVLHVIYCFELD